VAGGALPLQALGQLAAEVAAPPARHAAYVHQIAIQVLTLASALRPECRPPLVLQVQHLESKDVLMRQSITSQAAAHTGACKALDEDGAVRVHCRTSITATRHPTISAQDVQSIATWSSLDSNPHGGSTCGASTRAPHIVGSARCWAVHPATAQAQGLRQRRRVAVGAVPGQMPRPLALVAQHCGNKVKVIFGQMCRHTAMSYCALNAMPLSVAMDYLRQEARGNAAHVTVEPAKKGIASGCCRTRRGCEAPDNVCQGGERGSLLVHCERAWPN
jgi:hypothetical protein